MKPLSIELHSIFQEFVNVCVTEYHLNDTALYKLAPKPERHCLNPYLTSEADVEMKFGGFLQSKISDRSLSIHSQLSIYKEHPNARADLSVHKVENNSLWTTNNSLFDSLLAVIEVKYANFVNPDFDFVRGNIAKDILNLSSLKSGIGRFLLIIDEGCKISPQLINYTHHEAIKYQIEILSNNPGFNRKTNAAA